MGKRVVVKLFLMIGAICANINAQNIFLGSAGYGTESRGAYELYKKTGNQNDLPKILIVNTLEAVSVQTGSNSGSLEWCLTRTYPRIIVFDISGVIDYRKVNKNGLYIYSSNSYVNVYGQTAPGKGITIIGTYLGVGASHVLFQHIRIRPGDEYVGTDGNNVDCLMVGGSEYVVFDHCSFSWSQDETINTTPSSKYFSLTNSLIYNPLHYSRHVEGTPQGHGYAVLLQGDYFTFHKNVIYRSFMRNPAVSNSASYGVISNNYVSTNNFGAGVGIYGANNIDIISNVVKQLNHYDYQDDMAGYFLDGAYNVYANDNKCNYKTEHPGASEIQLFRNQTGLTFSSSSRNNISDYSIVNSSSLSTDEIGAFYWNRDFHDSLNIANMANGVSYPVNSPNRMPARACNYGNSSGGDMGAGYDWSSNKQTLIINGTTYTLDADCNSVTEVVNHINSKLPSGFEAVKHPESNYVMLQTVKVGEGVSFTLSGSACSTLGMKEGVYKGDNGDYGYPDYPQQRRNLELPKDPHSDPDGNGFTVLQEWIAKQDFSNTGGVVVNTNQSPSISSAKFEINDQLSQDDFVGKINATDPDYDNLTYNILSGNENGWFSLDNETGNITVNTPIVITADKTINLLVEVIDDGIGNFKSSAIITVEIFHEEQQVDNTDSTDNSGDTEEPIDDHKSGTKNALPIVVTEYIESVNGGTVGVLDATDSFDPDNDNITFRWIAPKGITLLNSDQPAASYLVPDVISPKVQTFVLEVNDGIDTVYKTLDITFTPHKPEVSAANIVAIKSSFVNGNNHPINLLDGDTTTYWSATGDNQWVTLEFESPIILSHIKIAFHEMEDKKAKFDVLVSNDENNWEPLYTEFESCGFSSAMHLVNCEKQKKSASSYQYIKLLGHGTNKDNTNSLAEIEVFGGQISTSSQYEFEEAKELKVYPNPASTHINFEIDEEAIVTFTGIDGKQLYREDLSAGSYELDVDNYKRGIYLLSVKYMNKPTPVFNKIIVQ